MYSLHYKQFCLVLSPAPALETVCGGGKNECKPAEGLQQRRIRPTEAVRLIHLRHTASCVCAPLGAPRSTNPLDKSFIN